MSSKEKGGKDPAADGKATIGLDRYFHVLVEAADADYPGLPALLPPSAGTLKAGRRFAVEATAAAVVLAVGGTLLAMRIGEFASTLGEFLIFLST